MEPFRIEIPESTLDDLRSRLDRTRYAAGTSTSSNPGMRPDELRAVVDHWRTGYDWRAEERRLNDHPQFIAELDDLRVHFVHLAHASPDAPAIVLTHGWPYTFAEMLDLADLLAPDFSVVVPSLPGFGFSSVGASPVLGSSIAPVWNRLMTETLGYERYLTYGEDVGAGVSDWTAALFPESVAGVIAPHPAFPPRDDLTAEETRFFEWLDGVWKGGNGYSQLQSTRPDTLAASLTDSPAGLAAWILEKFRDWSDGSGDVGSRFPLDRVLTTVMIYWVTGSIGTSFRAYADDLDFSEPPLPGVDVPAAVMVQQHEREYPRSLAERAYSDIRSFELLAAGGHFTAAEAPDAVARVIRTFAESLGLTGG